MKRPALLILVFLLAFCLASCEDPVVIEPLGCQLQSIQRQLTSDSITVVYKLEKSGDATINAWSYITPTGETTINNPDSPAEVSFVFYGQANPQVKAGVVVNEGFVKVSFTAKTTDSTYTGIDQCIQEIN